MIGANTATVQSWELERRVLSGIAFTYFARKASPNAGGEQSLFVADIFINVNVHVSS